MLRSAVYLLLTGAGLIVLGVLLLSGTAERDPEGGKRQLVAALGLTDLALFSEARYTRHPSQADQFSAFQDYPAAFEHFPSGSLTAPIASGRQRWIAVYTEEDQSLQ